MKVNEHLGDMYSIGMPDKSIQEKYYISLYDNYKVPPLLSYFTQDDINFLSKFSRSPYYHSKPSVANKEIKDLMEARGFRITGGGTNRRTYECVYDPRVAVKVAVNKVGIENNLLEFKTQEIMKPFCSKIFEVTPDGTMQLVENVVPIKSIEEFKKYSNEIFDIMYFKIRNNDLLIEDFGESRFKNWGYRNGFGPVILDYPTIYVADPRKRLCSRLINGRRCNGTLDYTDGFDAIECTECHTTYHARTLAKENGTDIQELLAAVGYGNKNQKGKGIKMRVTVKDSEGNVLKEVKTGGTSKVVNPLTRRNIDYIPPRKTMSIEIHSHTKEDEVQDTVETKTTAPLVEVAKVVNNVEPTSMVKTDSNDINIQPASKVREESIKTLLDALDNMITHTYSDEVIETMYRELVIYTCKDFDVEIDDSNVNMTNSLINDFLDNISETHKSYEDRIFILYKLCNRVQGAAQFMHDIINFGMLWFDQFTEDLGNNKTIKVSSLERYLNALLLCFKSFELIMTFASTTDSFSDYSIKKILNDSYEEECDNADSKLAESTVLIIASKDRYIRETEKVSLPGLADNDYEAKKKELEEAINEVLEVNEEDVLVEGEAIKEVSPQEEDEEEFIPAQTQRKKFSNNTYDPTYVPKPNTHHNNNNRGKKGKRRH